MELMVFDTPLGQMAMGEEGDALTRLWLPNQGYPKLPQQETPLLLEGKRQLLEYLQGLRREFSLPFAPEGTPFQRKVWQALEAIPYGETRSYQDIAVAVDNPKGVRAVGGANNRNPLPIFIPCHRVVGVKGQLTGYAGGLPLKEALLELERSHLL